MKVMCVIIQIKPKHREAFIEAMLDDARGSVNNEPGCLRFEVLQDDSDPNRICLYEVYRDEAAVEAHREAPHYLRWVQTVQEWFDGDRTRYICTNIFPTDANWK